jgi:hypothetical protein
VAPDRYIIDFDGDRHCEYSRNHIWVITNEEYALRSSKHRYRYDYDKEPDDHSYKRPFQTRKQEEPLEEIKEDILKEIYG